MIGIVILNYITWNETFNCLKSISELNLKEPYITYLVDNGSSEKMTKELHSLLEKEKVVFISAEKNKGYAGGNNLGIRKALEDGCDAILISNNDIIFEEKTIETLYAYLKKNCEVGIVGPKVVLTDGKMQQTNLGCKMTLKGKYLYILRKTPFRKMSQNFFEKFRISEDELKTHRKVFGVSGCCFMIRRAAIEKIGLLDEGTFLYEEENILGCQMEQIGYDVYLLPEVIVVHKHGQTSKHMRAASFTYFVESEIYYCRKYLEGAIIEILPLYLIRLGQYLKRCVQEKEYRDNMLNFISKTNRKMWVK